MEKLVINVPEQKATLVKQILLGLGVTIQGTSAVVKSKYKDKLTRVSIWSDDDIKALDGANQAFNDLKTEEW